MTAPSCVTGGTGTLGRLVVPLLQRRRRQRAGPQPAATTTSADGVEYVTGDLATGAGVDAAVDGVETILHLAGNAKGDDDLARTLVGRRRAPAAPHLVYISVVGAERVPVVSAVDRAMFGYFAAKRAAERVVAESGLPWTTLRATQFHDLILPRWPQQMAKLPVIPVPAGLRFQPVDAGEVAERLVELALGEPAGLVPDLGGPRVYRMTSWCAATCGPPAAAGRSCRCGRPARRSARSGPAPTWPRTGRSAAGPGRTSSPSGCARTASPGAAGSPAGRPPPAQAIGVSTAIR